MKRLLSIFILLVLIATAIYLYYKDPYSTIASPQSDFSIVDTASIGKIFIATTQGTQALIERDGDRWRLNDKFQARQDAVNTILKTFRLMYVREPVPKQSRDHILKVLAANHRKVEVYDREGKWIKTYYVGMNTADNKGTYMLLETPEGRSSEPFVTDMKGFIGTLYTRFMTNEKEWRSTEVFRYPALKISEISMDFPEHPEESYLIKYHGGNNIELYNKAVDRRVEDFDTLMVKDFMLNFKKAHFEIYYPNIEKHKEDSILASNPYMIIKVTDNAGQVKEARLFRKSNSKMLTDENGVLYPYDPEHIYGTVDGKELALAQPLIWTNFHMPLSAFLKNSY